MEIQTLDIPGVVLFTPDVYADERGSLAEVFRAEAYREAGLFDPFVQQNHSHSKQGVLRGLHFQSPHPQGKLVWAATGEIFDVAVDLRRTSDAFGKWLGVRLDGLTRRQLYIPPGCAHGFCVLSETADVVYQCTEYYRGEYDRAVLWNDPAIGVEWPLTNPLLSDKDRNAPPLSEIEAF